VNFISSAGWWTLIRVQRECRQLQHGEVVINGLAENVRDSMRLAGIEEFFRIFDLLPDAVASF
jgi:anti-anti-sigma regulatory factor